MTFDVLNGLFPSVTVFVIMCAATILAGALRGFSGFGASLLLAPIYSLFMPPASVVVVLLLMNFSTTLQMLPRAVPTVQWRLVMALFIPSLFGIPLGLILLHSVDAVALRRLIAVVVTIVSVILLSGWQYNGRRGHLQNCFVGAASGCLTGIAGIGGPPILLYLLSSPSPAPTVLRSVFIVYFGLVQFCTLVPLLLGGSVTLSKVAYVGALLPVYFLATALGAIAHRYMAGAHEKSIRTLSLLLLLAIGVITFFV